MARFLAALLLSFAAAQVAAAPITIDYSQVLTYVFDGVNGAQDQDGSTAYGTRTVTTASGGGSSTTYINWQDTGSGALFDFDFAQERPGTNGAFAYGREQYLGFTVGQNDTTYSLSGLYSMTGPASVTYFDVYLEDFTVSTVFRDYSYSESTANEFFTLGVVGDGDSQNYTGGSLTGTLLAGHSYGLYFINYIQAFPLTDDGATATGCVTLSIGGATGGGNCGVAAPVPLPAAAWLLLSGLGGLGLAGRRRKAA